MENLQTATSQEYLVKDNNKINNIQNRNMATVDEDGTVWTTVKPSKTFEELTEDEKMNLLYRTIGVKITKWYLYFDVIFDKKWTFQNELFQKGIETIRKIVTKQMVDPLHYHIEQESDSSEDEYDCH